MNNRKKYLCIIVAFVVALVAGIVCDALYRTSNTWEVPVAKFQKTLLEKDAVADSTLRLLASAVRAGNLTPIDVLPNEASDIVYYIFDGDKAVFWSDNKLDVSNLVPNKIAIEKDNFCYANNAYCVAQSMQVERYTLQAFIVIKYHYDLENGRFFRSRFADGFRMDNRISLVAGDANDELAVFGESGNYLFSLSKGSRPLYHHRLADISIVFYGCAFLLFLFLFYALDLCFGRQFWSLRNYILTFVAFGVILLFGMYLGWPRMVFDADMFSPIYYASGLISSLGHLLIITLFFGVSAFTFYTKVRLPIYRRKSLSVWLKYAGIQLIAVLFFLIMYLLLYSLIYNSSLDLFFYSVEQISVYSIVAVLMMFLWLLMFVLIRDKLLISFKYALSLRNIIFTDVVASVVLFLFTYIIDHNAINGEALGFLCTSLTVDLIRYNVKRSLRYWQLLLLTFVCSMFVVVELYSYNQQVKRAKYKIIAENMATMVKSSADIYMQKLLSDVDSMLQRDKALQYILRRTQPSPSKLLRYMNKNYFKSAFHDGVNSYLIKVFSADLNSVSAHRYDEQIAEGSLLPFTDHFYINNMKSGSYQFIGIFDFPIGNDKAKRLFVHLYKLNDLGQYDALFKPRSSQLNSVLSTAMYENGTKIFNGGVFVYPNHFDADVYGTKDVVYQKRYAHYVYRISPDVYVIVGERHPLPLQAFMLFWTYLFILYVLLVTCIHIVRLLLSRRYSFGNTFVMRISHAFIALVMIVLTITFLTSIGFFYNRYKNEQVKSLQDKTRYIEAQLRTYFGSHKTEASDDAELHFFLQDLSKLYHTDMHIYDTEGKLMATTRPYVFSTGLCGRRINPKVLFDSKDKRSVLPEKAGNLNYLASYATVSDAKGNVIAYVCVPYFYSSYRLSWELFSYCAIFINIYLFVLLLTLGIGLLAGNHIVRPLRTLEQKLRHIKLGHVNEKIPYKGFNTDEIGLLVSEYNSMVDKLAESARQLAVSERESAWRGMAQQIAHEIKNPLTPMKLTLQQLQRVKESSGEQFDDYFKKASRTLIEQIETLSFIATEFSNFARMPIAQPTLVDLNEKLISAVDLFRHNYENVTINYTSSVKDAPILADNEQMTQLFNNLLKNAIQAIPSTRRGEINVSLDVENDFAVVAVADNGSGISDEVAQRLFVPSFTTKSSGMGLGLCISKAIVMVSKGEISFETKVDEGTTFFVKFPLEKQ